MMGLAKIAVEQGFAKEAIGGHFDIGERCLVDHGEAGQCKRCVRCGALIATAEWDNECPQKGVTPHIEEWVFALWLKKGLKI